MITAYQAQLIAAGIHSDTAQRAAQILTQPQRSAEEQDFISEVWVLLCSLCPIPG